MKQWFKGLDNNIRVGIIVGCFVIAGLSVVLFSVVGEENSIRYLFSVLFVVGVVFGIIFSVWMKKDVRNINNSSTNNSSEIKNVEESKTTITGNYVKPQNDGVTNLSIPKGNIEIIRLDVNYDTINRIKNIFVAFDTETTGLSEYSDRIIEIAAVRFINGDIDKSYSSLIKTGVPNSSKAYEVNHISEHMLENAPSEEVVYKEFVNFIGKNLDGNITLIAHNADFDLKFLKRTLERLGYNGTLTYFDTLELSRCTIFKTPDHKLGTIAEYFDLVNKEAHRAESDAEICGKIFIKLSEIFTEINEAKQKQIEKNRELSFNSFKREELEVCAVIQKAIVDNVINHDFEIFRFKKTSKNIIYAQAVWPFIKFEVKNNQKYIIIPKKEAKKIPLLPTYPLQREDKDEMVKLYFANPLDLKPLSEYFAKAFEKMNKTGKSFLQNRLDKDELMAEYDGYVILKDNEIDEIIDVIKEKEYDAPYQPFIYKMEELNINPTRNKLNLSFEKNNESGYNFKEPGYQEYDKGCNFEKNKMYSEAIPYFEQALLKGYSIYAFNNLAECYRKIDQIENQIDVLEEALKDKRCDKIQKIDFEYKLFTAVQNYGELKDKENKKILAAEEKERKRQEKAEAKTKREEELLNKEPKKVGRVVLQYDDDMNLIKRYETISDAIKETGTNGKSIRDCCNGIQKHAGGFIWRFEDSANENK